jgi:hypothetical protein
MIFKSNGVPIHYEVFGEGEPIILVHGFASSLKGNWVTTSWIDTLRPVRKVIALDCRGHGQSGKPRDPKSYGGHEMEDDVVGLMNHLDIQKADLFGYSMGAASSLLRLSRVVSQDEVPASVREETGLPINIVSPRRNKDGHVCSGRVVDVKLVVLRAKELLSQLLVYPPCRIPGRRLLRGVTVKELRLLGPGIPLPTRICCRDRMVNTYRRRGRCWADAEDGPSSLPISQVIH